MTDWELLQSYSSTHSNDLFAVLMSRHENLVFSLCLRALEDRHLAEDASQIVFTILSARAETLHDGPLAPWLRKTAQMVCANLRRSIRNRHRHEKEAAMLRGCVQSFDDNLDCIDYLSIMLRDLDPDERNLVVLRYMACSSIDDMAQRLRISTDAAKKRLSRALMHLRDIADESNGPDRPN